MMIAVIRAMGSIPLARANTNSTLRALLLLGAAAAGPACLTAPTEDTGAASAADGPTCLGRCGTNGDIDGLTDFEYVVVGSGAGGGPLASRLAQAGKKVLLLEAGEDAGRGNLNYRVPAFHTQSTEDPSMQWDYFVNHYSDPQLAMQDSKMVCARGSEHRMCREVQGESGWEPIGIFYPRSGTLGGCTAHNAMITVYPHEKDWNDIASLMDDPDDAASWDATNMRQYFVDLESNRYLDGFGGKHDYTIGASTSGHGHDGWLGTQLADPANALGDLKLGKIVLGSALGFAEDEGESFVGGIPELFGPLTRDLNANGPERDQFTGLVNIPLATRNGERNSTRELILQTIADGAPLTVRLRSLVTNVVFADAPDASGKPRAIGVDFIDGAHQYRADPNARGDAAFSKRRVTVSGEVVLAAGSYNTPQLLMQSGIGPAEHLASRGVSGLATVTPGAHPVVDLPGVGANLQDRYEVGLVSEVSGSALLQGDDFRILRDCTFNRTLDDQCLQRWDPNAPANGRQHQGLYTSNGGVVGIVKRSSSVGPNDPPDLFVFGLAGDFPGYYPGYSAQTTATKRRFTWAVLKAHTGNHAGTVRLAPLRPGHSEPDPRDRPVIDFHYFGEGNPGEQDQRDLTAVVEGVQLVRTIERKINQVTLTGSFTELYPGAAVDTTEEVEQFVRSQSWGHHACGTAKIGRDSDPMAVLDGHFRVRGTSGLRVVDASVFPDIPGFFIVTPIYMIAEKAAHVMLQDGVPASGTTPDPGTGGGDGGAVEHEPNDSPDIGDALASLPTQLRAELGAEGDVDVYTVTVDGPTSLIVQTAQVPGGTATTDTVVEVLAPDGQTALGEDDDGGGAPYSRLSVSLPEAGTYYVRVRGYYDTTVGPYQLAIANE